MKTVSPVLTQPGCEVDKPCIAHKDNFKTIMRAAKAGALGLIECQLKATGERVAVIAAFVNDGKETTITPFAVLLNGNPYEMLIPPTP